MKNPELFLSYSWANKNTADRIYHDLALVGIKVLKDDHTLKYTDKLSEFMNQIRKSNFAILLISDSYLKSINCMTEVTQLYKEKNIWKKILPVILREVKLSDPLVRLSYVNYWQEKSKILESSLEGIDLINATASYDDLKRYNEITQNMNDFLSNLNDTLWVTPEALFDKFYSPLTEKIGVEPDFTQMAELLQICFINDQSLRLDTILKYKEVYNIEHCFCYSIIASCYRDLGQPKKAIDYYKKALELDNFDFTAWNNMGRVYELAFSNFDEAKKAYEKAILCEPKNPIARLNLGVLLSNHFNDNEGARMQYEEILTFDENNPSAHNNLGNYYRQPYINDLVRAEKHLVIAVNQDDLHGLMNYANFLKLNKKEIERGNFFYRKAKELDVEKKYTKFIDLMLTTEKG